MQESTTEVSNQYKKKFRKYIYPEIKDLGKQFLTLASAILTFAIFFARDFIDLEKISVELRLFFGASLIFLIMSIVLVGCGIWFNYAIFLRTLDAEKEVNKQKKNIIETFFLYGGFFFVLGLILLSMTSILRFGSG